MLNVSITIILFQASAIVVLLIILCKYRKLIKILKKSEGEYRSLADNMPDVIARLDRDGRFLYMNPASTTYFGQKPDYYIGKKMEETGLDPQFIALKNRYFERVFDENLDQTIELITDLNGRSFEVRFSLEQSQEFGKCILAAARDVTDRQKGEKNLEDWKDRLELVLQSAGMGVWEWQVESGRIYMDKGASRVFKLEQGEATINEEFFFSRIHEEDRAFIQGSLRAGIRNRQDLECTYRYLLRSGGSIWIKSFFRCIAEDDGERVIAAVQDVTLKEEQERELFAERERVEIAAATAKFGFWELDPRTNKTLPNRNWYKLLGLPEDLEDVQGEWLRRVHPQDGEALIEALSEHVKGKRDVFEAEYRFRVDDDREWIWCGTRGRIVEHDIEDNPSRIVGITLDTSEKHALQLKARSTEDRLKGMIFSNQDTWLWEMQADRKFSYIDGNIEEIAGYEASELMGQDPLFVMVEDEDKELLSEMFRQVMKGEAVDSLQHWLRMKSGERIRTLSSIVPLLNEYDEVIGCRGITRDISRQIEIENQLRQSQKMEAVGHLAGGVAHDFNNMLQVILGYGDMVLDFLDEDADGYFELSEVIKAGERAQMLVGQLLAFSRKEEMKPEAIYVEQLTSELLSMIRRLLGENIEISFQTDQDILAVWADPGQIEQLIVNLCLNARDAIDSEGRLNLRVRNFEVAEDYAELHSNAEKGMYVCLTIEDNGSGIPAAKLQHIFEPFYTTKEVGRGTGLGLATAYAIVQKHKGFVNVYSEESIGTRFSIYFPAIRVWDVDRETPEVEQLTDRSFKGKTVLIADDEEMVRDLASTTFTKAGFNVLVAEDGEEAVRIFEEHQQEIDLAFLDVIMPGKSGKEVYEEIKQKVPDLPVVFCSGYTSDLLNHEYLFNLPAGELLHKPYSSEELLSAVTRLLER